MHFLANMNQLRSSFSLVTWTLGVMVPSDPRWASTVWPAPTASGPFPSERLWEQKSVLTEEATLLAGLGEWPGEVLGHAGRAEHSVAGRGKVPCSGTCWSWELGQEGAGSSQKGCGAAALATFTVPTSGLGTGGGQIHPLTPCFRPAKPAGVESPLVPSQGDPGK